MGMEKEEIAQEVAKNMINLNAMHQYAVGQIQALEIALGTCLAALQSQPALLDQIWKNLESHQQMHVQASTSLPLRDGFGAMKQSLGRYMGEEPPGSVHAAPAGNLN